MLHLGDRDDQSIGYFFMSMLSTYTSMVCLISVGPKAFHSSFDDD